MIVITGAGGFIGSHLADALAKNDQQVLALDLPRAPPPNLRDAIASRAVTYRNCDVTRARSVERVLESGPETVIHAAAVVGVSAYVRTPMETIESSVLGTQALVRACMKRSTRLVYLSSSEVFGRNPNVPWGEEDVRVLGPPSLDRWSYSSSKGLCEHLVNAAHTEYGLPTTIVRPFNIYGPRQRPSFVIPVTVHRILNGEPPIIYGDGLQTRCFTYVSDLVAGILACLERDAASGETFNLGHSAERTMSDAIRAVLKACDSNLTPVYQDPRESFGPGFEEIPRRVPRVSKAHELLGWTATTDLESGVRATVAWARAHPEWLRARRG